MQTRRTPVALPATIIFLSLFFFLFFFTAPGSSSYTSADRVHTRPSLRDITPPQSNPYIGDEIEIDTVSQLIVKVKADESEDEEWIDSLFPTWRKNVITLDPKFVRKRDGTASVDKGRVASAYLQWIIENYNNVPDTVVFLSPGQLTQKRSVHQASLWHSRNPSDFQSKLETLQIPHVQDTGFAGMRCPTAAACAKLVSPFQAPPSEMRTIGIDMNEVWQSLFGTVPMPDSLSAPPTADFVVSSAQITKRSEVDYARMWTWLKETEMDDDSAGLLFEYLWHYVFGQDAKWCPDEQRCQCEVYGDCA